MIYIWIRQTLDWTDEAYFWSQLRPDMVDGVKLWNSTFKLPYHLYRDRLRTIADMNFSHVTNAICAEWDDIPDGEIVVPIDDDDWLAPDIGFKLEVARDASDVGWLWQRNFLEIPIHLRHEIGRLRRRLFPSTQGHHICITNNYAMSKRQEYRLLLEKHTRASDWFEVHMNTSVKTMDEPLSTMNRSIASTTSLREIKPPLARQKLLLRFHRYRRLYQTEAEEAVAWTRPYRSMMAELMEELL